jgi:hypothetical protein
MLTTRLFRLIKLLCDVISQTFRVPPPDVMEIRQKAGDIIPSIISSTAIIAGFMLLNSLQIATTEPRFVNVACDESGVILNPPRSFNPAYQYIYHFGKVNTSTKFVDIIRAVPSTVGDLHQCIFYANHAVTIPSKGLKVLEQKSLWKYIEGNLSLQGRKYFVAEFTFQRFNEEDMELLKETKYLIITLPKVIRQHYENQSKTESLRSKTQERELELEKLINEKNEQIIELSAKVQSLELTTKEKDHIIQAITNEKRQTYDELQHMKHEVTRLQATITQEREEAHNASKQHNANILQLQEARDAIAVKELLARNQKKDVEDQFQRYKIAQEQTCQQQVARIQEAHEEYKEAFTQAQTAQQHLKATVTQVEEERAKVKACELKIERSTEVANELKRKVKETDDSWFPPWVYKMLPFGYVQG